MDLTNTKLMEQIIIQKLEDRVAEHIHKLLSPTIRDLAREAVKEWAAIEVSSHRQLGMRDDISINIVFMEQVLHQIKQEFVIKEEIRGEEK